MSFSLDTNSPLLDEYDARYNIYVMLTITPVNGATMTFESKVLYIIPNCALSSFAPSGGDTVTPVDTVVVIPKTGASPVVSTPAVTYTQTIQYGPNINCKDYTETIEYKIDGNVNDLSTYVQWLKPDATDPKILTLSVTQFNSGIVDS